jgi:hypothetical protein
MKWSWGIEPKPEGFAENRGSDSFQIAMQPPLKVATVRGVSVL